MALETKIADPTVLANETIRKLSGGPVYQLGVRYNSGDTLKAIQATTQEYQILIAEGKTWNGNPESTLTAAYPREVSRPVSLPQPSATVRTPVRLPVPSLSLPQLPKVQDLPVIPTQSSQEAAVEQQAFESQLSQTKWQ